MDTSHISKNKWTQKYNVPVKKNRHISTCLFFFFSVFVNTWYAELSSQAFFTQGFAGTLATQPWFTAHDIETNRWKHGSNWGPRDPHAHENSDMLPLFGDTTIFSLWCVTVFPLFVSSVSWQNYLVAWMVSPGRDTARRCTRYTSIPTDFQNGKKQMSF